MTTAEAISKLSIPEDLEALARLPAPWRSGIRNAKPLDYVLAAESAYSLWFSLLTNPRAARGKQVIFTRPDGGKRKRCTGGDLWDLAILNAASYYDFAVRQLLKLDRLPSGTVLPPGFDSKIPVTLLAKRANDPSNPMFQTRRATLAGVMADGYIVGLMSAFFGRSSIEWHASEGVPTTFQKIAHQCIQKLLAAQTLSKYRYQKALAERLAWSLVEYLIEGYTAHEQTSNKEHPIGPFSWLRPAELSLLARRDDSVAAKYGKKHIERVFEQQLALIFQSLGFHVISTRVGQSTVDLVCVSPDPATRVSFLIEAKTSGRRYALPTRDARALKEYAEDVKAALRTFPPLGFILIVGDEPARTLPAKLTGLEASIGVPVRFCRAQQIADLRELIPGPVPVATFCNQIMTSPNILAADFANRVAQDYQAVQNAHAAFAGQLLALHQGKTPVEEAWHHGQS